ncbi:MAG: hypothetical protein KDA44_05420 [Planctomycetales bacterium]|nr:hypothetical protein [Planctomycetales bacterium]
MYDLGKTRFGGRRFLRQDPAGRGELLTVPRKPSPRQYELMRRLPPAEPDVPAGPAAPRSLFRVSVAEMLAIVATVAVALVLAGPDDFDIGWFCLVIAAEWLVVSLVRQAISIRRAKLRVPADSRQLEFSRIAAMAWRCALAISLSGTLLASLLQSRGYWQLPESEIFGQVDWASPLGLVTIILVFFAASTFQSSSRRPASAIWRRFLIDILASAALLVYAAWVVVDLDFICWFVHDSMCAIDGGLNLTGGRYAIDTYGEEWSLLRRSSLAALGSVVSVVAAIAALRAASSMRCLVWAGVSILGAAAATAFCLWYYRGGLMEISPDIAGAPIASN